MIYNRTQSGLVEVYRSFGGKNSYFFRAEEHTYAA
jgi:hypothetical protein